MNLEDKVLKEQIKQAYPTLNDWFIDLAIDYCKNNSEEEIMELLNNTSSEPTRNNIEETHFSVH